MHVWPGVRPGRSGPGARLEACLFRHRLSTESHRHRTLPPSPRCPGYTASTVPLPVRPRRHPRAPRPRPAPARGNGRPVTCPRGQKNQAVPGPMTQRQGPRGWPRRGQPSPRPRHLELGRGAAALASRSPRTLVVHRAARPRPPPCWPPSCATRLAAWAAPRGPRARRAPGRSRRRRRRPSARYCPPRQPARPPRSRPRALRRQRPACRCPTPPGRRPPSKSRRARRAGKWRASWAGWACPPCSRRRPGCARRSPGLAALLASPRSAPAERRPQRQGTAPPGDPALSVGGSVSLARARGGALIGEPCPGGKAPSHLPRPDGCLAGDPLPCLFLGARASGVSEAEDRRALRGVHTLPAQRALGWGSLLIG